MTRTLPLRGPIRRILVLRPRALGDVLLATPALRALRHGFSEAELHVAVDDLFEPILRANPHVDRLWLLPRRRPRRARDWWPIYRGLRQAGFDLVVDLHGSPRTAFLAFWTRAPNRVGYALRGRGRFYNHRIGRDTDRTGARRILYAAQTNLEIVARCGVTGPVLDDTRLVCTADAAAAARVGAWIGPLPRPRVGISAAGTWPAKTWPAESYARLADHLLAKGCSVVLLWGPGEEPVVDRVRREMRRTPFVPPPTALDELVAAAGELDLLVCNDSGIKHVAVARGTPTLTLFGPTEPRAWTPPHGPHRGLRADLPCAGCNFTACRHHLCMQLLTPAAVSQHAMQILDETRSRCGS